MVSFSCEACGDTLKKPKLDQHRNRCYGAIFTCLDCSVTFQNNDYRSHTTCISEAEKYQKSLYKGPKKGQQQQQQQQPAKESTPVKTNGTDKNEHSKNDTPVKSNGTDSETSKQDKKRKRGEGESNKNGTDSKKDKEKDKKKKTDTKDEFAKLVENCGFQQNQEVTLQDYLDKLMDAAQCKEKSSKKKFQRRLFSSTIVTVGNSASSPQVQFKLDT